MDSTGSSPTAAGSRYLKGSRLPLSIQIAAPQRRSRVCARRSTPNPTAARCSIRPRQSPPSPPRLHPPPPRPGPQTPPITSTPHHSPAPPMPKLPAVPPPASPVQISAAQAGPKGPWASRHVTRAPTHSSSPSLAPFRAARSRTNAYRYRPAAVFPVTPVTSPIASNVNPCQILSTTTSRCSGGNASIARTATCSRRPHPPWSPPSNHRRDSNSRVSRRNHPRRWFKARFRNARTQ
jgi:hypothetical protein